jgi:hypothetical protein
MEIDKKELEQITNQILDVKKEDLILEESVINNECTFVYKGKSYKLVPPTFEAKNKSEEARVLKKLELLQKPGYMMKAKLIEVYKEKGVNISDYDLKIDKLLTEQKQNQLKLATLTDDKTAQIDLIIAELDKIKYNIIMLAVEKKKLLSLSIEDIAFQQYVLTLIALSAYCREDGVSKEWKLAYKDVDDMMAGDEYLANRFANAASKLFDLDVE